MIKVVLLIEEFEVIRWLGIQPVASDKDGYLRVKIAAMHVLWIQRA